MALLSAFYLPATLRRRTLTEDLKEETLMNWEFQIQMELPLSVMTCFINI